MNVIKLEQASRIIVETVAKAAALKLKPLGVAARALQGLERSI